MNFRTWVPVFGLVCSSFTVLAHAQAARPADSIVAVVNSEPITQNEVRSAMQRAARDLAQQRIAPPATEELQRRVLERLINERAQLQHARETGIRVDEAAVNQAEQGVARQNQIDVAELHLRVAKDGLTVAQFRSQLRDQLTLSRLHEREVEGRLRITEADIDAVLAEQRAGQADPMAQEIGCCRLKKHWIAFVPVKILRLWSVRFHQVTGPTGGSWACAALTAIHRRLLLQPKTWQPARSLKLFARVLVITS
jgi:peptidyl-prolyl cis-trans isomerase SurA